MTMKTYSFLELARKRRSIRKYQDKPIERDKLILCLEAARLSPSACNSQPYKFIVVDDKAIRDSLAEAIFSGIYSICKFAAKAKAFAFIVLQKQKITARLGNKIQNIDFKQVDIGIAAEHFVLQAEELGLGTCHIGWFNKKKAAEILKIPKNYRAELMISIGYPDETPKEREKKNFDDMASFNGYQKAT
ncbi:MAG: nitroreductase family protein [Elusimicrobia bacterium]|nr:nitroreductase family protein [Elusimicrobiota bacterium]